MLVRGDGLGDALALAPLVAALTAAGHELGAVLSPGNAEAFAAGTFAHVHSLERIPWPEHGSTPASYRSALADARAARYDVALVASEEPEAYGFARAARIAVRTGFTNGWQKPLKTLATRPWLTRAIVRVAEATAAREHEVETLFRLGAGLHAEAGPTRDVARLRPLIAGDGAEPVPAADAVAGLVTIQYSAKLAPRGDLAPFVAIVRAIRRRFTSAVVGAAADRAVLARIAGELGGPACIYERLRPWIGRVAASRAVVTADSGAAHVAGMTGVPCVDLFPPNRQTAYDAARWSPWAAPHRRLVPGPSAEATGRAVAAALADLVRPDR